MKLPDDDSASNGNGKSKKSNGNVNENGSENGSKPAPVKRIRKWEARFLRVLSKTLNVSRAAEASGTSRSQAYNARDSDKDFRNKWDDAIEQTLDAIEGQMYRRSARGWLEPIYQKGVRVGYKKMFDTTAGIFLLKGRRKAIYGNDRSLVQINQGVVPGAQTAAPDKDLSNMSEAEITRLYREKCLGIAAR